jgi:superoxide dismutase, Fe-Mn family
MQPEVAATAFLLPPLPYPIDALEPYIDARTLEIHHGKHHAGYVASLNKAMAGYPHYARLPIEDLISDPGSLPVEIRTPVRNFGGGHANHAFYWQVLAANAAARPCGELARAINTRFGSFENLQAELTRVALGQFGSGWAWLTVSDKKELTVEGTANQETPLALNRKPLLVIDVWEHAYYLKYQNRRADYVSAISRVINWDFVSSLYADLRS